jgi:hypothetical protein
MTNVNGEASGTSPNAPPGRRLESPKCWIGLRSRLRRPGPCAEFNPNVRRAACEFPAAANTAISQTARLGRQTTQRALLRIKGLPADFPSLTNRKNVTPIRETFSTNRERVRPFAPRSAKHHGIDAGLPSLPALVWLPRREIGSAATGRGCRGIGARPRKNRVDAGGLVSVIGDCNSARNRVGARLGRVYRCRSLI